MIVYNMSVFAPNRVVPQKLSFVPSGIKAFYFGIRAGFHTHGNIRPLPGLHMIVKI